MPSADRTTYLIWRIVGNDLPPRHRPGSTLENVRFILEHEPEFGSCGKRWLLNRIVDPDVEAALRDVLDSHGATYESRPFEVGTTRESVCRYDRILRAIDINGARNEIIDRGRTVARYTIPLDGNNFFTAAAWRAFTDAVERYDRTGDGRRYFAVPMARVSSHDAALGPEFRLDTGDEPQLAVRDDADLRFDERFRYGYRDKMELLLRLGRVPGFLRGDDMEPHRYSENDARCPDAGYVIRLPSTPTDGRSLRSKERMQSRDAALDQFLARGVFGFPPRRDSGPAPRALRLSRASKPMTVARAVQVVLGEARIMEHIPRWTRTGELSSPEDAAALFACAAYGDGTGSVVQLGGSEDGAVGCLEAGIQQSGRESLTHVSVREYPRPSGYEPTAESGLAHVRGRTWTRPLRLLSIDGHRPYGDLMDEVFIWARNLEPGGLIALNGIDPRSKRTGGRRFYKDWLDDRADVDTLFVGRGLAVVRPNRPLSGTFPATDAGGMGKTSA